MVVLENSLSDQFREGSGIRDSKWQATSRTVPSGSNKTRLTVLQLGHGTATLAKTFDDGFSEPPAHVTVTPTD
jgi:hypothetical protein